MDGPVSRAAVAARNKVVDRSHWMTAIHHEGLSWWFWDYLPIQASTLSGLSAIHFFAASSGDMPSRAM